MVGCPSCSGGAGSMAGRAAGWSGRREQTAARQLWQDGDWLFAEPTSIALGN